MAEDLSATIAEFERSRSQLMGVSAQKAQLAAQRDALEKSIEELKATKEEKVFKVAGNIMVLTNAKQALKDVEEQKESVDLRFKTVDRQETIIIDKLNKLKMEIEKSQGKKTGAKPQADPNADQD
ncbi:MAG: prefoldin subunit [archaeon]